MTDIDNTNNRIIEFNLDASSIDRKIVKLIGIEKSSNSIIVEVFGETLLYNIGMESFLNHTINPLVKRLDEILTEHQNDKEKRRTINSIISCINRNIEPIYQHCKEYHSSANLSKTDENSKVDNLLKFALDPENIEKLFKDQYGKPCAAVRRGNNKYLEILPIYGTKFKRYLSKLNRDNTGSCISDGALNTVITNLASEADFSESIIPLHLRVAWGSEANRSKNGSIYYDMSDPQGRLIELSKDGWRIIDGNDSNVPILFRKHNQQPQAEPDRDYPIDIFDRLISLTNVKGDKQRHLLKAYIVSTLIPEIDHPIITTYGPKGSAKSFLLELIKKLIDPSKPILLTLHRNPEQFIQQVNHNYVNYYDNVKWIPSWLSDEICKSVTGSGHTKRELYSNDEDVIYEHRRGLGLNGINVALTESDALDRSLFIELEDIDEEDRRKEGDLWKEFEKIKPHGLGYVFDIISKAMQIRPTLNLKRLPRMADFAEWGEAISQAMGYPPMSFIEVYAENRNEQNIIAVNENFVGSIILRYIIDIETQQRGPLIQKIHFEPQDLYKALEDFAENNGIRIDGRQFPKDASNLVKKIKTVIPNLKAGYGVIIEIGRSADNTSIITISRKVTTTDNKSSTGGSEASDVDSATFNMQDIDKSVKNHNVNREVKNDE